MAEVGPNDQEVLEALMNEDVNSINYNLIGYLLNHYGDEKSFLYDLKTHFHETGLL